MPKKIDLTGQKFGYLTVQYKNGVNDRNLVMWHCLCDCGNEKDCAGFDLSHDRVKSCGCMKNKIISQKRHKTNKYNITDFSYGIGYTSKNEPFYFDLEDYELIKDYCWRLRSDNYLDAKILNGKNKRILMHNLIMNSKQIDHIGGYSSRNDNRKNNLRKFDNLSFDTGNQMNKQIQSNNKSGYPGVSWHKRDKCWEVHITINKNNIYLGRYNDINKAILVRKEAEEKYFGSYSYNASQEYYNNILKGEKTNANWKN